MKFFVNCRESRPDSSDPVILGMHYSRQTGVTAPASIEPLFPLYIKKKYLWSYILILVHSYSIRTFRASVTLLQVFVVTSSLHMCVCFLDDAFHCLV